MVHTDQTAVVVGRAAPRGTGSFLPTPRLLEVHAAILGGVDIKTKTD